MNYLGHIYLSVDISPIIVGNFIGDHVKGSKFLSYQPEVRRGILLHRAIDSQLEFENSFIQLKQLFYPLYRRYSGIIADMIIDYILARDWNKYHPTPLKKYSKEVYQTIWSYRKDLPTKTIAILPKMQFTNRLLMYGTLDGIIDSIKIMSRYSSLPDHTNELIPLLKKNDQLITYLSRDIISQMKRFSTEWLQEQAISNG
ncbi:DUF479 domain-containing protein [Prolixibacteraceae bacterium JC049]|nr:DUF479 domain-containing protein [Prolixibacteraceae bacterium JC049]